jgi:hypothetical protein
VRQIEQANLVKEVLTHKPRALGAEYIGVMETLVAGEETTKLLKKMIKNAGTRPPEVDREGDDEDDDDVDPKGPEDAFRPQSSRGPPPGLPEGGKPAADDRSGQPPPPLERKPPTRGHGNNGAGGAKKGGGKSHMRTAHLAISTIPSTATEKEEIDAGNEIRRKEGLPPNSNERRQT